MQRLVLLSWAKALPLVSFAAFTSSSSSTTSLLRSASAFTLTPPSPFTGTFARTSAASARFLSTTGGTTPKASNTDIMDNDDEFDEFGDTSFLENLNVDQLVETHRQSLGGGDDADSNSPSKRRKVSQNPPIISTDIALEPLQDDTALRKTLQDTFGYSSFRHGQAAVIQALVNKRDVAVFWATGQGKSLCYQIPALHLDQVAIVVSPLISLMQDQVHKLNGLSDKPVATFLGSAQQDPMAESKAMQGHYNLIYCTPEKLATAGFLDRLAVLHSTVKPIALFAVDESHCVSEWGHDFRPDFRNVGTNLRKQHGSTSASQVLAQVPILALTATAVPRVQADIMQSLQLRLPLKAQQTFDRTNLKISVVKRTSGGVAAAMQGLLDTLNNNNNNNNNTGNARLSQQSTIVYAPTRALVEEICLFLQKNIKKSTAAQVEAYHAGLPNEVRAAAHTNFLTGTTTVIVATVAFGMGIDKPDTRRVIHYGPPKTVEEYYQQIGRAGRDGLAAECIMYMTESDLDRYKSDFYLGGLTGKAKEATVESMDALRSFCLDAETCRRKGLLDYFQEKPPFGERCGTCDTCLSVATYGSDSSRDFGPLGARVVLRAIGDMDAPGLSQIVKVVSGKVVEDYRYKKGRSAQVVQKAVATEKESLSRKYPQDYYKELVAPLKQKGFLTESTKSANVGGFQRSWTVYSLTSQGQRALSNSAVITLPVPESVREVERKAAERREQVLVQLEANGIKRDKLPQKEVEEGDGEVIQAYSKWHRYLESLERTGKVERIPQMEALLSAIEQWRSATAVKQRTAPGAVLAEHTLVSIAYTTATLPAGMKMDSPSLVAAGVRTRELDALTNALNKWLDEFQPKAAAGVAGHEQANVQMTFPASPAKFDENWKYAVYKPVKKTGLAAWESSYDRFAQGESPQAIAMSPSNGRPIQVSTVVGHVLDAIVHGRAVDLQRLAQFLPPPSKSDWEQLQMAETTTGMDVTGDPNTSGVDGEKFLLTEFLRPIMGDEFVNTPYPDRTQADKNKFGHWCNCLKWYMNLRRVGYEPAFE